ncbi:hypothetical protein E2C01_013471 [Portunus trituberculatus]|uniref:Uncharacterized protein n=1 Tax=Portunus trituberculatus TaxID=210409 RepID=A0A5B7DGB1_PORTR|nr:hypothetical protein [Portunus trituberculatus]
MIRKDKKEQTKIRQNRIEHNRTKHNKNRSRQQNRTGQQEVSWGGAAGERRAGQGQGFPKLGLCLCCFGKSEVGQFGVGLAKGLDAPPRLASKFSRVQPSTIALTQQLRMCFREPLLDSDWLTESMTKKECTNTTATCGVLYSPNWPGEESLLTTRPRFNHSSCHQQVFIGRAALTCSASGGFPSGVALLRRRAPFSTKK